MCPFNCFARRGPTVFTKVKTYENCTAPFELEMKVFDNKTINFGHYLNKTMLHLSFKCKFAVN